MSLRLPPSATIVKIYTLPRLSRFERDLSELVPHSLFELILFHRMLQCVFQRSNVMPLRSPALAAVHLQRRVERRSETADHA